MIVKKTNNRKDAMEAQGAQRKEYRLDRKWGKREKLKNIRGSCNQ
jgi:hypothetical protein